MKKLFYFAALLLVFTSISCKKEPTSMKLDPSTMFYIKGTSQTKSANVEHLSNLEIVKQARNFQMRNALQTPLHDSTLVLYGGWQEKDTVSSVPAFLMGGYQIIDQNGDLDLGYISSYDLVICRFRPDLGWPGPGDTLAYIPNAQMRENERLIKQAYDNADLNSVLQLFNNAWTFIPCTGTEYLALKKAGNN